MPILVIAEHDDQSLKGATLNTVSAAAALPDSEIHVLVAGSGCAAAAAAAAKLAGVAKVKLADAAHYAGHGAENLAALIIANASGYSHLLAPATSFGKNLMPRVAAALDVAQISDVVAVQSADTFMRPIYAGNALATVKSADEVKVITTRTTAFDPAAGGGNAPVEVLPDGPDLQQSRLVGQRADQIRNTGAECSEGRCVRRTRPRQRRELQQGARAAGRRLGAALGASRAAVDAGFVPNDYQVGQTGKIVAPQLYFAIGISGAIQHLAGMKDSKVIVAINKDPEAPIFQVADYGLVGDLFQLVPELTAKLG